MAFKEKWQAKANIKFQVIFLAESLLGYEIIMKNVYYPKVSTPYGTRTNFGELELI